MFDDISPRIWLLIAIAAVAFVPMRYVYRHFTHAPERRDITQPPEDLSWRTSGQLVRSLAILAAAAAIGVFIFTPAAAQFARSDFFLPVLTSGLGLFALYTVATGFHGGQIQPLVRGISTTYEREAQPRRFWASMSWNAAFGLGMIWLSLATFWKGPEDRCLATASAETAQAKLTACDAVLGRAGNSAKRADILAERGTAYYWLGDYQKAVADYSQAIVLDPQDSYSLYNRGLAYALLGDRQRAVADYDESLKLRPDNADGYLQRGLIFLDSGQFDKAIADLTRAHDGNPGNLWAIADRGLAHAWRGDRAAAAQDFESVRKTDPSNAVVMHGEAVLDLNDGNLQSAINHLTEALQHDPKDMWALHMRGDLYWKLGQRDKARDDDDRLALLQQWAAATHGAS